MKRERRRISQGTGDSQFEKANSETRQKALASKGRKGGQRRTRKAMARIAVIYSLVATIYSLSFLSNTSFLQVEVANALAFKLPKPPRIVSNLINSGWPSGDFENTAPVIQDWSLDKKLSDDGDIIYSLIGTVTGHPAIADGDAIYTAPIASKDLETALNLLLETETSAKKTFILRGQTSEYATLISTEFGTRYSLLPPNIKISNAPLVSRGKGASGASSDGAIAKSLSNKDKLTYLEEQIEVVRLLAEREDKLEQQKRQEVAEIVRDAGVIVAAALTGAAYFVGDNPGMFPETTQTTAIVNTVNELKNAVKTTATATMNGAESSLPAIPEEEVRVAKPAKAILPYLEERIKALEDEQQKAREQESSGKTEVAKDEKRDLSESKDKAGVAKILTDIKESMTQSDSDTPNGANQPQAETRQEDEESNPIAKLQGEISKLRTDSKEENDDTKQTSVLPTPSSVQEGMTKIITDFKESIIQSDSGSDSGANDATNSDQNEGIAGADSGSAGTQALSQSLQVQQAKVVDQIEKIAEGLSAMGQDTSNEIGAVVSDLASAGKQVLGDAATSSNNDGVTNAKEDVGGLASSALSVFGEDGVMSIYQYLAGVLQTVYDTFSLDEMWSDVVDLSSKLKEDPRLSPILNGFNDYDEDEKVRLIAAASFVSVLGVTTAVARSQMYGYMEGTDEYENGMEGNGWYEYPPDNNQYASGWGSYDEGSFDGYSDSDANSPFPFATSNWDDQSNEYNNNGYSESQAQGWTDTSSSYDENWTQEGGSNVNYNGDEKPYFGNYDGSTSQVEDSETPKSAFSPFGNPQKDKVEATTESKAGSNPFGTPSKLPTNEEDNKEKVAPKKSFSPFGKTSSTKASTQNKEDNADSSSAKSPFGGPPPKANSPFGAPPSKTSSPFGAASTTKKDETEDATGSSKIGASPFGGPPLKTTSPFGAPPSKTSSPFGAASTTKKDETEDATGSSKIGASPFGGPPLKTTSPFGAPPSKTSSPFGAASTKKDETEDTTSSFKTGASPFGGPPPKANSPFGAPPSKTSSTFPASTTKKDETEDATSSFKTGASPFGGPPPKANSPFGAPPSKTSSTFPASTTKTGETEDGTSSSKTSASPFGGPPPKATSPFGAPPSKTSSPFGAASTKKDETEDATSSFKTGAPPFGGPPPKANSPFGAPKTSSPFGAASTKKDETENATSSFKTGAPPFGGPPPKANSPFGAPKKSSPFGASATKTGETEDATSSSKTGAAPFGGPPPKATSPFGATPKAETSPFGGGPPQKSSSFDGTPSKTETGATKTSFSPFGGPPTKSGPPFGAPQKLQSKEKSDNETSAPKAGISPFGGSSPKKSSTFGTTPPKTTTPFGSTPPKTTTPFGTPPKFPTSKQANKDGTSYFTDSSSSFGVPPPKKSNPFGGPPSNQNSSSGTPPPAETPDLRIRPKMASKPQNDMYERMQQEQEMRLAEYERKNGISSQKDKGTSAKSTGEGGVNFATTPAPKKAKIEPERRTMARPRSKPNNGNEVPQRQFDGRVDEELSEEDLEEKERMTEIQKLAREQARFEIEARGLSKEEKALQEKDRMERLHKLAREQARFEYDRKRSQQNRGEPIGGTSKKEKTNIAVGNPSSSKPKQKNTENQNRKTLFQTADTPSVEESMQNRVRQEFSNEPTGKRVTRPETSDFEVNVREPARQVRKSAKQEDALMGTKKKTSDRSGAFATSRSVSNEETSTRSEKARREQLKNLAEKQAQYKKDRTMSSGARNSGKQMNKGQIIDVEAAEDDSGEDRSRTVEESDMNEEPPSRPQKQDRQEKKVVPKKEKKTFTEKRKQLEVQARQRAKQQFRRNDKFNVQKKDTANGQRIQPDSTKKTPPKIEETESQDNLSLTLPAQPIGETKQQQEIGEAVMRTDGSYQPSAKALSDTSRMLKEVRGFSLSDYNGSKEFINKKSNVSVYVGRTLSVPVRVSTPGSFIEFSITRKASDFDMTILAVPDKGYAFDIKKTAPFTKYAGKTANTMSDTVLIGAPSTPCTLQFKFENKGSTLLDKVIISYSVKVTSPSRKLLLDTRRLRAESCLETIEKDIKGIKVGGTKSLEDEIKKLEAEMKEKNEEIDSLKSEENRWNALIEKMKKKASKQKS